MTTAELIEKLSKRFAPPTFAFLTQVRNSTGYPGTIRTADALAMGLWPSRGLHLHGFEVKISRADLMRELMAPEKAEEIAQYCDFWWLVLPDPSLLQPGELPQTWGLITANGRGGACKIVKEPTKREDAIIPPWFLASIFRSATTDMVSLGSIEARINEAEKRAEERYRKDMEDWRNLANQRRDKIVQFERASGLSLDMWDATPKETGAAVKAILRGDKKIERLRKDVSDILATAERVTQNIRKDLQDLGYVDRTKDAI